MLDDDFDEYLYRYEPGRTICREGKEGDSFFLIKEGLAQVTYESKDGGTIPLNTLGPGDVFGEMALLGDPSVRSATVTSETSLRCWKFSDEKFEALLETSGSFRQQVMKLLTNRLRESNQRLVEVRELQQLLYRCSFLLVELIDRLGPVETARKTLAPSPVLRTLKDWFDVPHNLLVALLENPSLEELRNLPESLREKLLDAARTLIQDGLDQLTFRIHPPENAEDESTTTDPDVLLGKVQSLHERVDSFSAERLRENSDSLRQQYHELERLRNRLREEPGHNRPSGSVDSYLEEIHRILVEAEGGGHEPI